MVDKTDEGSGAGGGSKSGPAPIVENLLGAEVYADDAAFFSIKSGNIVSITFTSLRFDNSSNPGVVKNVVVGRLVMPLSGAQSLSVGLYDFLKQRNLIATEKTAAN